eukprot:11183-Heterococcus_DN1.PRE.3
MEQALLVLSSLMQGCAQVVSSMAMSAAKALVVPAADLAAMSVMVVKQVTTLAFHGLRSIRAAADTCVDSRSFNNANSARYQSLSFTDTGCCMSAIKAANRACNSISDTACMVKSATLPVTNQNPGQTPPVSCGNGSGVYNSDQTVCCDKRCGYCGGGVCHQQFPSSAPYCCQSEIIAANKQC